MTTQNQNQLLEGKALYNAIKKVNLNKASSELKNLIVGVKALAAALEETSSSQAA